MYSIIIVLGSIKASLGLTADVEEKLVEEYDRVLDLNANSTAVSTTTGAQSQRCRLQTGLANHGIGLVGVKKGCLRFSFTCQSIEACDVLQKLRETGKIEKWILADVETYTGYVAEITDLYMFLPPCDKGKVKKVQCFKGAMVLFSVY